MDVVAVVGAAVVILHDIVRHLRLVVVLVGLVACWSSAASSAAATAVAADDGTCVVVPVTVIFSEVRVWWTRAWQKWALPEPQPLGGQPLSCSVCHATQKQSEKRFDAIKTVPFRTGICHSA